MSTTPTAESLPTKTEKNAKTGKIEKAGKTQKTSKTSKTNKIRKTGKTPISSQQERPSLPSIGAAAAAMIHKDGLTPENMLTVIEAAIREHLDWLGRFHRVLICGGKAPRDIISEQSRYLSRFGAWVDSHRSDPLMRQPVIQNLIQLHDQMRDDASFLTQKNAHGQPITAVEYDLLSVKISTFFELANQVRDAFQHARSDLDPLTGLHNRQVMMTEIEREQQRALRSGIPCCLVLADIDHFKKINDTYGHAVGDRVLRAVAFHLMAGCRPYDQVYRAGGEEFILCLPNAPLDEVSDIAERLRGNIAQSPIEIAAQPNPIMVPVTLSLGIVAIEAGVTLEKTIERADVALYYAKHKGRNRICSWPQVKRAVIPKKSSSRTQQKTPEATTKKS